YVGVQKERGVPNIADSAVGRLVNEVFSFGEYHASTPYGFRKKTPSPRSIHPFLPIIHYHGYLFLYDAGYDDFIYFGYDPTKQDRVELIICVDLWRTCSVYGEFGIPLSLLELGHLLSDIKWLVNDDSRLGIEDGEFCFTPYASLSKSNSITNADDLYVMGNVKITKLNDPMD
ncbi:hypothetical protein J4G37_46020, partial [Microvirga sp. 3-52]|nr:hypothetical protein [Microvirga sp. 3-52]